MGCLECWELDAGGSRVEWLVLGLFWNDDEYIERIRKVGPAQNITRTSYNGCRETLKKRLIALGNSLLAHPFQVVRNGQVVGCCVSYQGV